MERRPASPKGARAFLPIFSSSSTPTATICRVADSLCLWRRFHSVMGAEKALTKRSKGNRAKGAWDPGGIPQMIYRMRHAEHQQDYEALWANGAEFGKQYSM